ncbi:hypothetical protein O6H91_23G064900 [Diphasiastrum complanatum]|uniref:Uncharacterized protein n=1 Tax=Diphasiastrum complanatum TaxID=34168 RepID=A0ACC2ABI8_DIPCM|nr:hypothetical protein O6H91_23G064900 [Diphasiastrum complanatum]
MRMERVVGLSLVLALAMLAGVYSDSQPDCSSQLAALAPCLPFVQGQTNTADTGCCVALNTAHKTSPACLCQLIASKTPIPGVNLTKAEQLPALCNITDADPSKCGISGPSTAPAGTPTPAGGTPKTNSTGGSSPGTGKNSAASTMLPSPLILVGLITGLELLMSYSLKF